jgi:hypothetical protein
MSELDQLLAQLPMSQIAAELGVDEAEAQQATRDALPALLGGLQSNIADETGALSLGQALQRHDPGLFGADLSDIDVQDGDKILGHILGDQRQDVIARLGGGRSGGSGMIGKLLPILAPIVLSYLSGKLRDRGGLGGVLGDVVGGSAGAAGGGLGDVLDNVLGGGRRGGDDDPGSASSGMPGADELPEQPTGPLIPTDGGEPADVTRGGQTTGGGAGGAGGSGPLGGVLGDILGQVLGGAGH